MIMENSEPEHVADVICKNNMHIHLPPNFSAFESVKDVVDAAVREGVKVLGVSNYYYHDVYKEYEKLARAAGIFPMFGIEVIAQIDELQKEGFRINDPGNPGRMYLCGKGITKFSNPGRRAAELMEKIRQADRSRMAEMVKKLSGLFCERGVRVELADGDIVRAVAMRHKCMEGSVILQERHVARAFQEEFFGVVPAEKRVEAMARLFGVAPKSGVEDAVGVQGEIRSHCMKAGKPAFVEEKFVNFDEAYELILELGGIPCYPVLADGAAKLCEFEADTGKLVDDLKRRRIFCVEFIPERNKPDVLERYVLAMRDAGMVVVAGTEHNTQDIIPIEPRCAGNQAVPENVKKIFREGACVVAGHAFQSANGERGFVDRDGVFESDARKIHAFYVIGKTEIEGYFRDAGINT